MNSCRLDVESITSTLTSVVYIMFIPFSHPNRTAKCVRSLRVKYIHHVHEKNYNTVYVAITLANNAGF